MDEIVFTQSDFQEFRQWLNLNLDGLTWQGRFKKEFESFWDGFFATDLTLKNLMDRFEYAAREVKIGSLSSWFTWLRNKFLCYVFIFKGPTIYELATMAQASPSLIATIIRNFLFDEYPHLDRYLSSIFHVGNILSPNLVTTFLQIKNEMQIEAPPLGSNDDEIMPSMEVTLFEEWSGFVKKMNTDFNRKKLSFSEIRDRAGFLKQMRVIQEVALLLFAFTITIYAVKGVNVWYEKYLLNKVSIYEPTFSWLNKSLVFKSSDKKPTNEFKLNFNEIKDITKGEKLTEFFDPEKYEEETEVTLSSFDKTPKDFSGVDNEASQYEGDAENPNGYRETKGGTTKVYRLMMTSSNTYGTRDKLSALVKRFQGEAVGDSVPGMDVPGGVYYNVYIPRKDFKDFMTETMKGETSKLFESNTSNVKNVPGKTRVFIMVKSL
jgi:hypothetical protein